MVSHHLPTDLLMSYAAGTTPEAVSLVCATHVTLCATCRQHLFDLEDIGAALFDELSDTSGDEALLEAVMQRLDEPVPAAEQAMPSLPADMPTLPRPVLDQLARGGGAARWRNFTPGLRYIDLPIGLHGHPSRLVQADPGEIIRRHTHTGMEYSVVLSGAYVDAQQHYVRGDVAVWEQTHRHQVAIDGGEACVSLLVTEGPLIPLTLAGRLASVFKKF